MTSYFFSGLKKITLSIAIISMLFGTLLPTSISAEGECEILDVKHQVLNSALEDTFEDSRGLFYLDAWSEKSDKQILLTIKTKNCAQKEITIVVKSNRPNYKNEINIENLKDKKFLIEGNSQEGLELVLIVKEEFCQDLSQSERQSSNFPIEFFKSKTEAELAKLLGYSDSKFPDLFLDPAYGSTKTNNGYWAIKNSLNTGEEENIDRDFISAMFLAPAASNIPQSPYIEYRKTIYDYLNFLKLNFKNKTNYQTPCEYYFGVESPDGLEYSLFNKSSLLRYSCEGSVYGFGSQCEGSSDSEKWIVGQSVSNIGGISNIEKDSPCYDPNNPNTPLVGCQELLAPLPGFGDRVDEKLGLGQYINTLLQMVIGFMGIIAVLMIIASGVKYMTTENFGGKANAKETITNAFLGLFIAVSIFIILKTINPDLLNLNPGIGEVNVAGIELDDTQKGFINSTETAGVVLPPQAEVLAYEPLIAYLYHQQGPGGGPTVLWAAKNGYEKIPNGSPFMKNSSSINTAITAQDGNAYTPTDFVNKFYKILKSKEQKIGQIPVANRTAVEKAAQEVGMSATVLKTICMIESYDCTQAGVTNKYGYTGLFQFHPKKSWPEWRKDKSANIKDPYDNAYAGARFMKSNLKKYQKDKQKI